MIMREKYAHKKNLPRNADSRFIKADSNRRFFNFESDRHEIDKLLHYNLIFLIICGCKNVKA